MHNIDIRDAIRRSGLYGYQIAAAIGLSETSFSRQLARAELQDDMKQSIFHAIQNLVAERVQLEAKENER